jgi:hypothetical protein
MKKFRITFISYGGKRLIEEKYGHDNHHVVRKMINAKEIVSVDEIVDQRDQLIMKIISLHNLAIEVWNAAHPSILAKGLNVILTEAYFTLVPDKYYFVESLAAGQTDDGYTKFTPQIQVRYHLTSMERRTYNEQSTAFKQGYLSTMYFTYEQLNNSEEYIQGLIYELSRRLDAPVIS